MDDSIENPRILIHAFGNPGRGDDAIGSAFLEMLENWLCESCKHQLTLHNSFQLNIETAYEMSEYDIVVFVDAVQQGVENFEFSEVIPTDGISYTTHSISPASIVHLCKELYGRSPETYLLQIRGYRWDLGQELTEQADKNLWKAFHEFKEILKDWISLEKELT